MGVRYVGSLDAVSLAVPVEGDDEPDRHIVVQNGDELPSEVDGLSVPAEFVKGLLEQSDNWAEAKPKKTAAKAEAKED